MGDATVGALASVPALARPDVATATSVNLIFTATERDRIAYVAFVASVNPTDEVKVVQEGRVTPQTTRRRKVGPQAAAHGQIADSISNFSTSDTRA